MAPQQKGKQGTKGAKQIMEENKSTLTFYKLMALAASALSLAKICIFEQSTSNIILLFLGCCIFIGCYQFMHYISRPKLSETGQVLDTGVDLNIEGGIGEHVKDIIILTTGCIVLALYSNYFWYLWLLVPIRGGWMVWKNMLQPYFMQQADEQPEVNEKKQKKMERKMKRMQR